MNLLNAFGLLNMINEDATGYDYQEEYKKYILAHKERVREYADWLEENLPELFTENKIDLDMFDEVIGEHDESKFDDDEFDAYAQRFYNNGEEDSLEFKEAWKHHYIHNEHHPEHWLGEDMPYIYILEMLCDWGSFGLIVEEDNNNNIKDYGALIKYYYNEARDDEEKNLSDNTKIIIEEILDKIKNVIE